MNDAFLPGNGFDTYEEQDRVLMGLSGSVRSGVAVRILQQQGFAVAAAVVRLADTPEEHAAVDEAKALAKKLDVECVTLNAEALAGQDAEAARFAALLTAADKLGIQYIASGRYARIETDAQGMSHLFAPRERRTGRERNACRSPARGPEPSHPAAGRFHPGGRGRDGSRF